jgi:hypothetical protein
MNDFGQLGDGTQVNAGVPMAVSTAASPATWSKIAAGEAHTCAISADAARQPGSVWCWGARSGGAAARAAREQLRAKRPTKHAPAPLRAGINDFGELGVDATATPFSATPVQTGVADAVDLSAGELFACAVVGTGVECWCAARRAASPPCSPARPARPAFSLSIPLLPSFLPPSLARSQGRERRRPARCAGLRLQPPPHAPARP